MFPGARYLVLLAIVAGIFLAGVWSGSSRVQSKWDKAENAALTQQIALTKEAEDERDAANQRIAQRESQLSLQEQTIRAIKDELEAEINKEPVVTTITVESGGECPSVSCAVPDVGAHFRLYNAAISGSSQALPVTAKALGCDDSLFGPGFTARVDGIYGNNRGSTAF